MRSNHENALLHVIIWFRVTVKFWGENCPLKVIFHFFSKFTCYIHICIVKLYYNLFHVKNGRFIVINVFTFYFIQKTVFFFLFKKTIFLWNYFTKTNVFPSFARFERQHFWQVLRCVQQGDQTYNVFSFVNVFEEKAYLAKPLAPNLLLDTSFLTWAAAICLLPHVF